MNPGSKRLLQATDAAPFVLGSVRDYLPPGSVAAQSPTATPEFLR